MLNRTSGSRLLEPTFHMWQHSPPHSNLDISTFLSIASELENRLPTCYVASRSPERPRVRLSWRPGPTRSVPQRTPARRRAGTNSPFWLPKEGRECPGPERSVLRVRTRIPFSGSTVRASKMYSSSGAHTRISQAKGRGFLKGEGGVSANRDIGVSI